MSHLLLDMKIYLYFLLSNFLNELYFLDEAPHSTERFDGANGESTQRNKAISERHQRIVERAVCFMLLFRFKYTGLA
jgi:hypothetical protein